MVDLVFGAIAFILDGNVVLQERINLSQGVFVLALQVDINIRHALLPVLKLGGLLPDEVFELLVFVFVDVGVHDLLSKFLNLDLVGVSIELLSLNLLVPKFS